jgi:CDP-diacylglycerol pyrophosphatase
LPSTPNSARAVKIAWLAGLCVVAAAVVVVVALAVEKHQRNALWHIVQLCVADQVENGKPRPCSYVSLSTHGGYVVLEDPLSRAQVLVLPTRRISGIESPELQKAGAPNYWQDAWQSKWFVSHRLRRKLPRDGVGLAVNSSPDRSQDQLHIHVDCLLPDVRQQLGMHADAIGTTWKQLDFPLAGRRYFARRVEAPNLEGVNPFRLLGDWVTSNGGAMWRETLVVAGVTFAGGHDGFVLLADSADPEHGIPGHGESLLDHNCVLGKR